jgi:hypothetical protein
VARNGRFLKPASRYSPRRDIALALAFKAVALTVLYYAFFMPHPVTVTPERVAAVLGMPSGVRH